MNLTELTDDCLCYVTLSVCMTDEKGELRLDTAVSYIAGFNPVFGTVHTFRSEEEAIPTAKRSLDDAIADYARQGFSLRCAPKTIDVDYRNWRRIARVGKPGQPSVCLQVVIDAVSPWFDGWIW